MGMVMPLWKDLVGFAENLGELYGNIEGNVEELKKKIAGFGGDLE